MLIKFVTVGTLFARTVTVGLQETKHHFCLALCNRCVANLQHTSSNSTVQSVLPKGLSSKARQTEPKVATETFQTVPICYVKKHPKVQIWAIFGDLFNEMLPNTTR